MDSTSQQKVIKAGFMIIRTDDSPNIRIKYKGSYLQSWSTLEKFETKSARDKRFQELLKGPMVIAD
jgi:hypothetical protein